MDGPEERIECRTARELLSQRMDAPLSPVDRAHLELHLAVCGLCVLIEQQFRAMRAAIRRL